MKALSNPREERFAQARAAGMTADAAYVEAGYKRNDSNAARMNGNERIRARIAELQKRAEDRFELSRVDWLKSFLRIAGKAERKGDYAAAKGALREIGLAIPNWYAPEELAVDVGSKIAGILDFIGRRKK